MESVNFIKNRHVSFTFLFIVLIVLAVFSEVLVADFVMWDDDIIIYKNEGIGKLSLERVLWAFTDVESMMRYNPLTLLSWCATYHFWELNPFGYHLVNWLLHALSSGLLFLILRNLFLYSLITNNKSNNVNYWYVNVAAIVATLFWAIHPLRVEPVAWATDRTYCQATFFIMVSTYFYIQANLSQNGKFYLFTGLSFVFYFLSLLSYAIGITFFAVFFMFDVFLFKRIGGSIGWWKSKAAQKVIVEKILFFVPAFLLGVISVIIRIKSAGVWKPPVTLAEFGLIDRIMQAVYNITYYAYNPFVIKNWAPVYTELVEFEPLSFSFLFRFFIVLIVSITLIVKGKKYPLLLSIFLTHIILLIPVLGLFEHPYYPVDRYSILSSMCFSVLIGFFLIQLKNSYHFGISILSLLIILVVFYNFSAKQIKVWNNSESLFKHMIATLGEDPYREDIYQRLGRYLFQNGNVEEAEQNFRKALQINPYNIHALKYLADIDHNKGELLNAASHLEKLLVADPANHHDYQNNLNYIINELRKKNVQNNLGPK